MTGVQTCALPIYKVVSLARMLGFITRALTFSPVKGPEGNIEYLIWLSKDQAAEDGVPEDLVAETVKTAHAELDR